ncbi:hypothetical protein [Streptomyces iconiensis]|uniref:Uncharacterized protein n=1 Tax=Streptomyces iconiensis TaxID=1384038 RepID=A0ABT6ZWF4_9ACTN|nr:hypothetical protein [Streptomyces iconiensis]MDJ1133400.1 hypothetical protein [Streptomyces iconiensis]
MVRGRRGTAVVGVLVGALLGTGLMAWRSGELPFVQRDVCWSSLSPDVAGALFTNTDVRSTELPLRRATEDPMHTECSIQAFGADELESEVTASVRTLGELKGAQAWNWTREYLSSRMTPLGGGTPGMASSTRAWAALPASCQERSYEPGEKPPLRVVSLASDKADPDFQNDVDARRGLDAMSRAVVRLADGVMERYGCEGRYADPPKLPRPPEGQAAKDLDADRLCGLPGVRLPEWARDDDTTAVRTTPGTSSAGPTPGGIRSCDVGRPIGLQRLRLTTVADPELARVVSSALGDHAEPLGGDGEGAHAGGLSVYSAKCQTGQVTFVAYEKDAEEGTGGKTGAAARDHRSLGLAVLPSYVKSEAKRIGCGEVDVKVPRLPS